MTCAVSLWSRDEALTANEKLPRITVHEDDVASIYDQIRCGEREERKGRGRREERGEKGEGRGERGRGGERGGERGEKERDG